MFQDKVGCVCLRKVQLLRLSKSHLATERGLQPTSTTELDWLVMCPTAI